MSDESEAAMEAAEESYRERHGTEPVHDCDGTCPACENAGQFSIAVDGLPRHMRQGTYAMYFTGMEHQAGAPRPVLRFRFAGVYPQIQYPVPEPERTGSPRTPAGQAEAEGWLPRREEEANQWPREMTDRARAAQQAVNDLGAGPPDLYQVSTVETINVTKLAHVIAALANTGTIDREAVGMQMRGQLNPADVETWLRS